MDDDRNYDLVRVEVLRATLEIVIYGVDPAYAEYLKLATLGPADAKYKYSTQPYLLNVLAEVDEEAVRKALGDILFSYKAEVAMQNLTSERTITALHLAMVGVTGEKSATLWVSHVKVQHEIFMTNLRNVTADMVFDALKSDIDKRKRIVY